MNRIKKNRRQVFSPISITALMLLIHVRTECATTIVTAPASPVPVIIPKPKPIETHQKIITTLPKKVAQRRIPINISKDMLAVHHWGTHYPKKFYIEIGGEKVVTYEETKKDKNFDAKKLVYVPSNQKLNATIYYRFEAMGKVYRDEARQIEVDLPKNECSMQFSWKDDNKIILKPIEHEQPTLFSKKTVKIKKKESSKSN